MARYYRRRYRTIVRAPKKKWASNFRDVDMEVPNQDESAHDVYVYKDLAENSTEANSPTPVIVKVGNFKIQADFSVAVNTPTTYVVGHAPTGILYVMYWPQGISASGTIQARTLIQNHPEWIMGWRAIDFDTISVNAGESVGVSKLSLTSRLKRNLNSGDKIVCIAMIQNLPAATTFSARGMCQFWTCAN